MSALISFEASLIFMSRIHKSAPVSMSERRVDFLAGATRQQAEAAKLDAAIWKNLKELGF